MTRQRREPHAGVRTGDGRAGDARTGGRGRPSRPRLTALGTGLFAVSLMLSLAALDVWLLAGDPVAYGVCFVLVSAVAAVWVRTADLLAAPVAGPPAYVAGLFVLTPGADGAAATLLNLFTAMSLQAGWLYGGTLLAGVIVLVRRVRLALRRRAAGRTAAARQQAAPRDVQPG